MSGAIVALLEFGPKLVNLAESLIAAPDKAKSERYQLVSPFAGLAVYALKKAMSNGEAAHYLCANCFQSSKRSFVHHSKSKDGWVTFVCSACRFEALTRLRGIGPDKYAEEVTETH